MSVTFLGLARSTTSAMLLAALLAVQLAGASGLMLNARPLLRTPTPTLASAIPRRHAPASISCLADSGDGGDGGAGGVGDGGGGDNEGEGNDGDGDESPDLSALLTKLGLDLEKLPRDMQAALRAGRIGESELSNWKGGLGNPVTKVLAASAYIRCRLLAEPRLPTILAIEVAVGCLSTLAAEKAARGEAFQKELDFVLANQVLIVLTNIALVLALTPAAPIAPPAAAGTLAASAAALPGFFLQAGSFSAAQRTVCFVGKAVQFSIVGSLTSAVGQGVTKGLVEARSRMNPDNPPQVTLAPVLPTAAAYAVFMAASSNTRYQIVNSIEAFGLPALPGPPAVRTLSSFTLRTINNVRATTAL